MAGNFRCHFLLWMLRGPILGLFPCWCSGVLAGVLASKVPITNASIRRVLAGLSIVCIFATVVAAGAHALGAYTADYLFALESMVLIWVSLAAPCRHERYGAAIALFSEFSYTLYVTHSPFLYFVKSAWLGVTLWRPDWWHVMLAVLPLAGAFAFAFGFYCLFEKNTDRLRKWIAAKLVSMNRISVAAGGNSINNLAEQQANP